MRSIQPSLPTVAACLRGSALLQIASLFLGYWVCAEFAITYALESNSALVLWLPNALVLSAMLLSSKRNWWKFGLLQVLCELILNSQTLALQPALLQALVNLLEVLLCAALLRRIGGRQFAFSNVPEVLLFAAIAMGLVPAMCAGLALALQGASASLLRLWLSAWLGHAMGMALLTPLVVRWLQLQPPPQVPQPRALRTTRQECLAFAGLLTMVLTDQGLGLQGVLDADLKLHALQHYMAALALTALPTAALVHAMAHTGRSLHRCSEQLQSAQAELIVLNQELEQRVAQRTAELERLATTDALTDTHNRRFLMARAEIEIALAKRNGQAVSLVILDIDHFKHINDSHGHNVGDRVLVALTQAVKQDMRLGDTFARVGGEEFVMLLPHSDAEQAWQVAERLRAMLEALVIKASRGLALHITASFGVATLSPNICTVDALCLAADTALYQAKAAGRNCVVADRPTSYSS